MSEPVKNPFDALLDAFRQIVREEIAALKTELNHHSPAKRIGLKPMKPHSCTVCRRPGLKREAVLAISLGPNPADTCSSRGAMSRNTSKRTNPDNPTLT